MLGAACRMITTHADINFQDVQFSWDDCWISRATAWVQRWCYSSVTAACSIEIHKQYATSIKWGGNTQPIDGLRVPQGCTAPHSKDT